MSTGISTDSDTDAGTVIGIDLAWGHRSPTGVAVADRDAQGNAHVRTLTAVGSDTELDAVLEQPLAGACIVGIDAPLRVENPTGRRLCEAEMSRAFGPEHAGVYPSNTGLPHFADGGRGAAFVRRHRLPIDPAAATGSGDRRALEVFPHSVAVAVFDLPRVLAYKARTGRTLERRRSALLELFAMIVSLGAARSSGLPALTLPAELRSELTSRITAAPTAAALRRLEDPIDALLCAYAALLYVAGRTVILGEERTGTIVTPVRDRHLRRLDRQAEGVEIGEADRFSLASQWARLDQLPPEPQ